MNWRGSEVKRGDKFQIGRGRRAHIASRIYDDWNVIYFECGLRCDPDGLSRSTVGMEICKRCERKLHAVEVLHNLLYKEKTDQQMISMMLDRRFASNG